MPKKKILLIEDDLDVRQGLGIRLKANDYDVYFAGDAASGLAEAGARRPDLIILDLGLPGEDGYLVLGELVASPQAPPIVVFSARDRQAHEQRVRDAGAKVFFQKPVDNEELLGTIRQLLTLADQPHKASEAEVR
jgi:two-component system, OmpR family, KDP operon response regulator KdpE